MSANPNSILFAQRPATSSARNPGAGSATATIDRASGPEARAQSRSSIRPAQQASQPRPTQPAASRPAPPWDLTTRVPTAVSRHVNPEDLTLFAMQLLSAEEGTPVSRHVEHCAECRRELAQIRGDLGAYAFTVDMRNPATSARERLMKQVAREKKALPISHSRSAATIATFGRTTSILVSDKDDAPPPSRTPVVLAWAGWATAAALGITAGLVYMNSAGMRGTVATQTAQLARVQTEAAQAHRVVEAVTDPEAQRVTLSAKPLPPSAIARTTYNPDKGTLIFLASDMDPLQPDKTYELWLMPADGSNPLPAGTFHPDDQGNASVIMPSVPKGVQAKGFSVTVEDEGGAQTPSKPVVMSGF